MEASGRDSVYTVELGLIPSILFSQDLSPEALTELTLSSSWAEVHGNAELGQWRLSISSGVSFGERSHVTCPSSGPASFPA
jgi:hypothetical protein